MRLSQCIHAVPARHPLGTCTGLAIIKPDHRERALKPLLPRVLSGLSYYLSCRRKHRRKIHSTPLALFHFGGESVFWRQTSQPDEEQEEEEELFGHKERLSLFNGPKRDCTYSLVIKSSAAGQGRRYRTHCFPSRPACTGPFTKTNSTVLERGGVDVVVSGRCVFVSGRCVCVCLVCVQSNNNSSSL